MRFRLPEFGETERSALRVTLLFALFGVLWIFVSDYLVEWGPFADPEHAAIQTVKGLIFVGLCTGLIFLVYRQSRQVLTRTHQRLVDVQRISHTGDWWLDAATGESRLSEEMHRILGVPAASRHKDMAVFLDAIHPDDRPSVDAAMKASLEDDEPFEIECRVVHDDGGILFIHSRAEPWRRSDGTMGGLYGTAHDVTARRKTEERLRFLSRAVEQSPASILITDPTGDILYVNPTFSRVTGYSADEVIGRNPRILKSGVQDEAFYRSLWATVTSGREWRGELCNRRKDGGLVWEVATISPVVGPDGEITHFVAVKEDLTEKRLLEKKFEESQKMEAVGRLAGGIAHDFNNVLTAIGGHARLLLDEVATEHALRADVEEIVAAADRAGGVIRQLLLFSRQASTHPTVVDLNVAVDRTRQMLERLLGAQVDLRVETPEQPSTIRVDPVHIDQILVNLAINARDAMPGGGTLRIAVDRVSLGRGEVPDESPLRAGPHIMLRISDTGTGMTDEVKAHIFEPFFSTKDPGKGTGLGLATVFGMVKQNDAHITCRTEVGRGTTFTLYFAAIASGEPLARSAMPGKDSGGDTAEEAPDLSGREVILLVEDEAPVRSLVRRVLARLGYHVIEACDGREAEHAATTYPGRIDLLLTDTVMPGIRGPEVARRIKAARPEMEVIYMSGYTFDETSHDMSPDTPFLAKPFTPDSLGRIVRDTLNNAHNGVKQPHGD